MDNEKYNTLKNALILEKNDNLLEKFKKLIKSMDYEENNEYLNEYKKYDFMSLSIEDEEQRVSKIIDLIRKREKEHNKYEDDYSYITGEVPDFLTQILHIEELTELDKRLNTINEYLVVKERIVNLSMNIKEYRGILQDNPNNRRINTKLNKSTKKVNDLLNSLKKENILILLYEFCIIDTFDKDKVNNGTMLKNILSTKVKRNIDNDDKKEDIKEDNNENKINIEENNIDKEVIEENNEESLIEENNNDNEISEKDVINPFDSEEEYVRNMIPAGMPVLEQIGTVKPVSMMEKLEKAQESEQNITLPTMGVLDNQDNLNIDSNDFVKNNTKIDKIS